MAQKQEITQDRRAKHHRAVILGLAFILLGAIFLPAASYLITGVTSVYAQTDQETNARAEFWRTIRQGHSGYSAVQGRESNVLIQNGGQNWRQIRTGPITVIGGWVIVGVIAVLLMFYVVRGPVKVENGRAGKLVPRWSLSERVLHWYTAILFIILAITGLSFLFGRSVLIPLLGAKGFSLWASFAYSAHNYLGPAFTIGVLVMIIVWFKNNLPEACDWQWFLQGGGMIKGKHPSAGKANAGEKLFVYWIGLLVIGIAACVSGLILDFPLFEQTRKTMQLANMVHGITSIIWITLMCGHTYLGSAGIQGAFEGMKTGSVDANWAKQHHDVWYENLKDEKRSGDVQVASVTDDLTPAHSG